MFWYPTPAQASPTANRLTAEKVNTLQIGETVYLCGDDKDGKPQCVQCTVAFRGSLGQMHKFLTFRVNGQIRRCAIKDYPGKYFSRKEE